MCQRESQPEKDTEREIRECVCFDSGKRTALSVYAMQCVDSVATLAFLMLILALFDRIWHQDYRYIMKNFSIIARDRDAQSLILSSNARGLGNKIDKIDKMRLSLFLMLLYSQH